MANINDKIDWKNKTGLTIIKKKKKRKNTQNQYEEVTFGVCAGNSVKMRSLYDNGSNNTAAALTSCYYNVMLVDHIKISRILNDIFNGYYGIYMKIIHALDSFKCVSICVYVYVCVCAHASKSSWHTKQVTKNRLTRQRT